MAAGRAFGRWHLKGGRYERHGLPVEMLSEFASYERLVVDVARAIYKSRHARRTRVPRGFASGFELRLTDVQPGSVVPVLEVPADSGLGLVGTDVVGVFDEARILIQSTLRAVSVGEDIPRSFPPQALREFSRFGRSLRDGESIEFDEGTSDAATYSQSIRRMLQERAKLDRFEVETLVVGQVVGLLADKAAFEFRLAENGRTIPGRFSSDEVLPDLKEYLDASTMASTVAISAVVITSMTDAIVEISDVLSIEPVLPSDWSGRLKALSELRDGWFDGSGGKIGRHVLRATESLLLECLDAGIARPGMYPTEDGGVRLEWAMDDREVTVDVRADRTVTIFAFSKLNDDEIEHAAQWHEVDEVVDFISGGLGDRFTTTT